MTVSSDGMWYYGLRAVDRCGNWSCGALEGWWGIDRVEPNVHVAVEVEAERFLSFFIERMKEK